ncbi:MAG: heat-inducible transcription repressor HrcA [Chloroflexi bacterium]|nr:heat-inducible transcription repressor HrcA [Chloroflexota bacterium]
MLTERQETILKIVVDDYTRTAMPIASETIVREHELGVSAATVRNDVAALEDAGYIARPHTSAGSVPLDKAYRFYVETFAEAEDILPLGVRMRVSKTLSLVAHDVDEWANVAAAALASLVGNLAIATFPIVRESRIRHLELVHIQDLLVMLIVVMEQARLRKQIIRLPRPVQVNELEDALSRLKSQIMGLNLREIESKEMALSPLEEELVDATVLVLKEEEKTPNRQHYVDGLRNLLSQPEFSENDRTRAIVGAIEDGSLVQTVLDEAPDGDVVRVIIGEENREDMLSPLSVVICRYGIPDEAMGAVGVVGPTRMEYSKTIGGVRFISSAMSSLVENAYSA